MANVRSCYLWQIFNLEIFQKKIKGALVSLRKRKNKFDTIVFRGASGTLFAPTLALKMNKHMLMVRKNDGSHAGQYPEGNYGLENYVIVDDFIESGKTLETIKKAVENENKNAKCVGVLLYAWCQESVDERASDIKKILGEDIFILGVNAE